MIFYVGCCGLLVAGSQGSPRSGSSLYLTMRNVWISKGFSVCCVNVESSAIPKASARNSRRVFVLKSS